VDPVGFRAEVEAELSRLASVHSGQLSSGTAPLLHGATVQAPAPEGLGATVAASVWHTMVPRSPRGDGR
jgi:hypothetical protein